MSAVNLLWITPDAEKTIEYAARVSSPKNQKRMDDGELETGGLLRYCAEHKHWSVFEMANACLCLHTERDISAQILRHRSFSFQEFSTRYAEVQETIVVPELRRQAEDNRQSSTHEVLGLPQNLAGNAIDEALSAYRGLIAEGVARETARRILPLCTPTKLYMNGTIRSWIHYFDVRCGPETQKEHRELATQARSILACHLPLIAQAFNWKESQ